ncbi:MAG: hypothetical protein ACFFE8_00395 [Candidatus Heimdallarchaeota archaeon]
MRDSRIPCRECKDGTLHWNKEETIYVCTSCGVQEDALPTWIEAAEHRQKKGKQKREKERQWALDVLGIKDKLVSSKKTKKEKEWEELIEKIKLIDPES